MRYWHRAATFTAFALLAAVIVFAGQHHRHSAAAPAAASLDTHFAAVQE